MKMIEYDTNIYKSLCQLDRHCYKNDIAINVDVLFDEYDVSRIQANGWHENNNYYIVIHNIDTIGIQSLINTTPILKGVIFDIDKINFEQFKVLYDYAEAMNLYMIFIQKGQVTSDILNLLGENFEIRGSLYEI